MANEEKVALRYGGGADLTFRDADGARRKARRGEEFTTDPETAAVLLADPAVRLADDDQDEAQEAVAGAYAAMNVAQLKQLAGERELDVPAKAKKGDLVALLTAADEAASDDDDQDEASSGETTSEPSEEASASSDTGVITLGSLPDSAKVGK